MDILNTYFPLSFTVRSGDVKSLAVALVIYVLAGAIASILNVVLGWIPLVGILTQVVRILLWIYAILGSLLAVALFFREGKNS